MVLLQTIHQRWAQPFKLLPEALRFLLKALTKQMGRLPDSVAKRIAILYLTARNRFCPIAVVGAGGPVVSLSASGHQVDTVHLALESIGRGSLRPSRLLLWVADIDAYLRPPVALRRLAQRGLQIRYARSYGPHTGYYPYVESEPEFDQPLAIADGDTLYPRCWLKRLARAYRQFPHAVNCCAARVVGFRNGKISPFACWQLCQTSEPSFCHQAMGPSGAIYPPAFLAQLKEQGEAFRDCCPQADDLWLHAQAIRGKYKVRQIAPRPRRFRNISGTREQPFRLGNSAPENDQQVEATYTRQDLMVLALGALKAPPPPPTREEAGLGRRAQSQFSPRKSRKDPLQYLASLKRRAAAGIWRRVR